MCSAPKARGALCEPTLVYFCVYFASHKHSVSQIFCLCADFFLQRRQEPGSHLQPLAPGCLLSRIWCSHRSSLGSVPGQGAKTPLQATAHCGHRRSASRAPLASAPGPHEVDKAPILQTRQLGAKGVERLARGPGRWWQSLGLLGQVGGGGGGGGEDTAS